jgi:CRP/FNR family transcriptional regulator
MLLEKDIVNIPRFSGMAPSTRKWLFERLIRRVIAKGEFVFMEGEECDALFIVEQGAIRIFKSLESGRELTMDIFYQGEAVGEVALIDETPFPASAVALEDSKILKLRRQDYQELLRRFPDAATSIIRDLSLRIRALNRRVQELGSGEVEQRLALVALTIAERSHPDEKDILICDLSRQELASLVGARIETVIRTISRWYKEGVAIKSPMGLHIRKRRLAELLKDKFTDS